MEAFQAKKGMARMEDTPQVIPNRAAALALKATLPSTTDAQPLLDAEWRRWRDSVQLHR